MGTTPSTGVTRRRPAVLGDLDPELRTALGGGQIPAMADPHPILRRLRRDHPVIDAYGVVSLYRYDDVAAVLRHPAASSDDRNSAVYQLSTVDEPSFLHRDPPDHTRLRKTVARAVTARVAALRVFVQRWVDDVLDTAPPGQPLDLVATLADPLPVAVVCELLGIPAADRPFVAAWPRIQLCCSFEPGTLRRIAELELPEQRHSAPDHQYMADYFAGLIERRRRAPGADLVSALLDAGLSDAETNATLRLLFVAGYENTVNLLGPGLLALLRHPEQWTDLRAHPGLVDGAVDEALRYDAPFQFVRRIAAADLDIGGHRIDRGRQIIAWIAAANRDPDHFADPDRFDIRRTDNRHLAFGTGIHACLGSPLARAQAEIVFTTLTRRLVDPHLAAEPSYRPNVFRSLETLPVDAGIRAA